MSSIQITIFKGRVAQTTKANSARNLPEGLWSVVCSNGLYDKVNGEGTVSKSKQLDAIFYTTKGDAWEESAYVLGKRTNEREAETALRRGRSVNGGITEGISMTVLGNMGIGRVAGEYNSVPAPGWAVRSTRRTPRTRQQSLQLPP